MIKISLTNIIIIINIIIFIVQNNIQHSIILFGLNIYIIKYHLWYQLLSTMFIHGGFAHILMNMFVLFQFGNQIETNIGKFKYLLLYITGGLLTSLGSLGYMYYSGNWANLIGASGAISVLIGFLALRDKFNRQGLIIWILLISFAPLLLGLPIAWYSHIIGFIIGWVLGYIL
ncbi:FIG056164: rhomboid family serine protease [hydrothermal vent metagenome]|uniref:FIG056164: rhomboid family serine protease n=1 Tax=hydrothermal vent metagenome TaxID=652676 RepID=A0A3B1DRX9_9ZZZZ